MRIQMEPSAAMTITTNEAIAMRAVKIAALIRCSEITRGSSECS
jgi:hypothetical protein